MVYANSVANKKVSFQLLQFSLESQKTPGKAKTAFYATRQFINT